MEIKIEATQSPNILKFVCPTQLIEGDLEFVKGKEPQSGLSKQLFAFPFITQVYVAANFVAIKKTQEMSWDDLKDGILGIVENHYKNSSILPVKPKAEALTLYAEITPNPNSMKFVANQLLTDFNVEAKSAAQAKDIPLALELFKKKEVKEVFISDNYVTIIKSEESDWQEITMPIRELILNFIKSGAEIVKAHYAPAVQQTEFNPKKEFSEIELQIKDILEEYIKPAVANDGGNIDLIEFKPESKTAYMLLQGSCSGCPSSTVTLKNGIETMLKQMLPNQVEAVEAINA